MTLVPKVYDSVIGSTTSTWFQYPKCMPMLLVLLPQHDSSTQCVWQCYWLYYLNMIPVRKVYANVVGSTTSTWFQYPRYNPVIGSTTSTWFQYPRYNPVPKVSPYLIPWLVLIICGLDLFPGVKGCHLGFTVSRW